jgi:hypothetical protein
MKKRQTSAPVAPAIPAGKTEITLPAPPPGVSKATRLAQLEASGLLPNAVATRAWSLMPLDLTEVLQVAEALGARVSSGQLEDLDAMLAAQSVTLNAVFVRMMTNAAQATDTVSRETCMRLALRCQSQCRATAETLATMKLPPVFTRQANFANGPQQVNTGPVAQESRARVEILKAPPSKLLETSHGERMDGGTSGTAACRDSVVEAVVAIDRPHERGRQGARQQKRLQRRKA